MLFFQKKHASEPIYAEPSKPLAAIEATISNDITNNSQWSSEDREEIVQLRHVIECDGKDVPFKGGEVTYENTSIVVGADDKIRHSDSQVLSEYSSLNRDETYFPGTGTGQRKFHSKSFSLSENRVAANLNLFQQNRELWEKRTEMQSQQCLTAPRILTRHRVSSDRIAPDRIAPDLVMDLPVPNKERTVHSPRESLNSSDETANYSNTSNIVNEKRTANDSNALKIADDKDMTSAERFASQNQCTLKKNERFSGNSIVHKENNETVKENLIEFKAKTIITNNTASGSCDKPKVEIKPQESNLLKEFPINSTTNRLTEMINEQNASTSNNAKDNNLKTNLKDAPHKSPIPNRNTQKFVSQFGDRILTGGCLSTGSNTTSITTITDAMTSVEQQSQTLSSFKPQVKVKPQILRKPLVLPPTTPEMVRRNQE